MRNPTGIIPALSTPTTERGELDEQGMRSLVTQNIEWGVDGVAVSIVAGEFYKFSDEERRRSFEVVIDQARGKVPIWAGVNHIGTEPAYQLARHAKDLGAYGIITMPPLVGVKSDEGVREHFSSLLARIDLPMMLQDSEDFTGIRLAAGMYAELMREYSNFSSVKIEGGDTLKKMAEVLRLDDLGDVTVLGGMGGKLFLQELALGTHGTIPGSCLTDIVLDIYRKYRAGSAGDAAKIFARYREWLDLVALNSASSAELQKETSRLRGIIRSSHTRSPHVPLGEEARKKLPEIVSGLCSGERRVLR